MNIIGRRSRKCSRTHIPWLEEEKELRINGEGPCHFLMEGDNLGVSAASFENSPGKIDLIIIDPPYNRGKNDFIYDDDYVDTSDDFRHSKWASFRRSGCGWPAGC